MNPVLILQGDGHYTAHRGRVQDHFILQRTNVAQGLALIHNLLNVLTPYLEAGGYHDIPHFQPFFFVHQIVLPLLHVVAECIQEPFLFHRQILFLQKSIFTMG